jgi:hypothetical protein
MVSFNSLLGPWGPLSAPFLSVPFPYMPSFPPTGASVQVEMGNSTTWGPCTHWSPVGSWLKGGPQDSLPAFQEFQVKDLRCVLGESGAHGWWVAWGLDLVGSLACGLGWAAHYESWLCLLFPALQERQALLESLWVGAESGPRPLPKQRCLTQWQFLCEGLCCFLLLWRAGTFDLKGSWDISRVLSVASNSCALILNIFLLTLFLLCR